VAKGTVKLNGNGSGKTNGKATAGDFFGKVLPQLQAKNKIDPKTGTPYRGVHVVYSGLNTLVGKYYGLDKEGVRAFMDKAAADGIIRVYPARGGATAYLPSEAPKPRVAKAKKVSEKDQFINGILASL